MWRNTELWERKQTQEMKLQEWWGRVYLLDNKELMVQQLSVPGLKLTSIAVKWQQMPTTSSICPAPSYLLLWATKRTDVHSFFLPLLHPWLPVQILVALYILHDCVLCQGLWPCCSPVCWAPLFVLTFTKMYWRIETCTQLRKLLLNFSFSLFPTPCFPSNPCQLIYTMAAMKTNELQRHAMKLKTPTIQIQWDERNRPHICHMNFQPLTLYHS